jgi:hypothetical protein
MNKLGKLVCILLFIFVMPAASADFKQGIYDKVVSGTERVGEELHGTLILAKSLGFYVNEIRFEISLTPKIEVFFRDNGDTGKLPELLGNANKVQKGVLRLLQSTRKFNLAHYSPVGIKLITGVAKPSVEILTTWQE